MSDKERSEEKRSVKERAQEERKGVKRVFQWIENGRGRHVKGK